MEWHSGGSLYYISEKLPIYSWGTNGTLYAAYLYSLVEMRWKLREVKQGKR